MNRETLEQKRDEAEQEFNSLQDQKRKIEEDMLRAQGKHRMCVSLLGDLDEVDPVKTIDVEPTLKKEDENAPNK